MSETAIQTPEGASTPVGRSDERSVMSRGSQSATPTLYASRDDVKVDDAAKLEKDLELDEALVEQDVELPIRPFKEYLTVSVLCLCVAFGGFTTGWDTGTISGFLSQTDFLRRFGQYKESTGEYYLSNVRMGLLVAIFQIGSGFGSLVLSKLGDMYGRCNGLMMVTVVYIIGIVIQISSSDKWYQYFIGRIVAGLGAGSVGVIGQMLISETAPKHLRGTLMACWGLMTTFAIFLGYCTNYGTKSYDNSVQWRVPLGMCFLWALVLIGGLMFVPESPRFLLEKGRHSEAERSFAKSNKLNPEDPAVHAEIDLMAAGLAAESVMGSSSWKELLSKKTKVFQRLVMSCMINSLQQLTGSGYFFFYGTVVFKSVGLEDPFETSIVLGVVNFVSTILSLYTIDNLGRRRSLLWGAAGMCVCMVIYASVGVSRLYPNGEDQPSSTGAGNCMIVFTCFYLFFYATTWSSCCFVIISETFPLRIKSKCMSVATMANCLWAFAVGFFTPFITSAINFYYGYVFVGCLVFMYFYVFFFVPETKGLSLEQVEEMWHEGVLPWKSGSWLPLSKRTAEYDVNDLKHDEKPWYKQMF
ncbi:LAQU0S06e05886g1_1 [Lachancea quebecensis]|uniref:LAQU0S06e05886g1_1 n=1 Tax=Lachancea quebecensis TaxID=1654605 RepID=A0A0P1KRT1_9SACH|nr:LAQU0S06e05886g1_1 [Lachancea quebecensis]